MLEEDYKAYSGGFLVGLWEKLLEPLELEVMYGKPKSTFQKLGDQSHKFFLKSKKNGGICRAYFEDRFLWAYLVAKDIRSFTKRMTKATQFSIPDPTSFTTWRISNPYYSCSIDELLIKKDLLG